VKPKIRVVPIEQLVLDAKNANKGTKRGGRKRMRIIWSIPGPGADDSRVHFGAWQEWLAGTLGQQVYLPHVWVKPGDAVPTCPDCGTPFKKTREYPGMVKFLADCMDKHDPSPQFDLQLNS
jgi:hypothetical protein